MSRIFDTIINVSTGEYHVRDAKSGNVSRALYSRTVALDLAATLSSLESRGKEASIQAIFTSFHFRERQGL